MIKLLKVRFLLPLLVLVYVLLGGFVVPKVDRASGHLLLIVLAVAALALLVYWFYRYDTYYRDPSMYRTVLKTSLLIGIGLLALIIYHVIAIAVGLQSLEWLYGGEVAFVILAFGSWIIYQNNKPSVASHPKK